MDWDDTTNVARPEPIEGDDGRRDMAYVIVLAGTNVGEMHKLKEETTIGRGNKADIRLRDDGISRIHCVIRHHDGKVTVKDLESRNGTFCNGERIGEHPLADGDKIQVGRTTILKFTYHDRLEESFQKQMYDSALRDPLTRAYNKRYFLDRLDSELKFALRHRTPLTLMLLDLDHFKAVNDTHGHVAGDKALLVFSEHIRSSIRNEDVFARYGGEEFAIISRGIRRHDSRLFAERLRAEVSRLPIVHDGEDVRLTTSIGVATVPENPVATAEEIIQVADKALYEAKEAGRNQVMMAALDD